MIGHSKSFNCLYFIRFNYLSWRVLDPYSSSIQMSQHKVNACQCLYQRDLFFEEKIGSFPFEQIVLLLLNYNDHISCLDSWVLICFSMEHILFPVGRTFINLAFNYLLFFGDFFSITSFAFILFADLFSLTSTVITRSSPLSVHSWPNHLHFGHHSSPIAT